MYAIVRDVLYVCQSANSDNHGKVTIYWYPDGYIQYLIVMQHPANSIANVSTTNRLFDELGKMLHTRKLSIVVADAATQGLFALVASRNPAMRTALDTSLVVHTPQSLKTVLHLDVPDSAMDQLSPAVGAGMARNALELSQAQLAIALTQSSAKPLDLPNCVVLGVHWWYRDRSDSMSSWMLSQQFVVPATREEQGTKLVQTAVQETIKVLRLQEAGQPAA